MAGTPVEIFVNGTAAPAAASEAKQDAIIARQDALLASQAKANAAVGLFDVLAEGRVAAVAGPVVITLHADMTCKYVKFWLSDGASEVGISETGNEATENTPRLYASEGRRVYLMPMPTLTVTVWFPTPAVGVLNWVAGN